MLLKIFKNRTVSSSGTWGTKNENNYEILNFEFPEELEEYNKRIVYYLGNQKVWDPIIDNKVILTNAITTKESVKAYVWCTKSDEAFETDVDFRTQIFVMNFFENENADGIVPTPEQVDGFNTMLTAMNNKIAEVNAFEQTIEAAERTRQANETTRQKNEQTRQSQEADRERRTDEAIADIEDKTAEYNANAEEKTEAFNTNASQKTNDFNSNYTQKVNDFNTNASSKELAFNSNASSKTTEFNTNAENKTSAFNDNATQKTTNFDNNASEKTDEFNTNAQNKIDEYDEHIVEYQAQIDELQEEVEELSDNMPWNTTEQATEISVDDAAKYSKNKLELFGNTEQAQLEVIETLDIIDGIITGGGLVSYGQTSGKIYIIPCKPNNTYQIKKDKVTKRFRICDYPTLINTNTTLHNYQNESGATLETTYLTSDDANYIYIWSWYSAEGDTEDNIPIITAEIGITPDYPQNIHVVSGENTIRFYKNLYNPKTAKISHARQNVTNEILNFEKNKKYYVYANNNTWLTVFEYKGSTILNIYGGTSNSRKVEFTVSNEADRIIVEYYQGHKKLPTDYTNIYFCEIDEYIEYSDQQYIYPLNLGDIELCQINFYQDTFFKNTKDSEYYDSHLEENGWYLIQKIIKDNYTNVSNNRIEDVTSMMNNGLYGFRFYTKKSTLYNISTKEVFCTHFAPKYMGAASDLNVNNVRNSEGITSGNTTGNIIISLDPTRLSEKSTKAFGDYMKSINPIIAYILTTPIITQITDETLISQLDAIYEHLQLVKGTNIATITASDLAPYMKLTYMQDLPSKLDNLDSRLALLE